jgi:hypothetical protein
MIKKIINYIYNINFDIIHVKNAFDNKYYELFELLYTTHNVKREPNNYIFNQACALGLENIVKMMLENSNTNPGNHNNSALILAIRHFHYNIVKLLIKDPRVNQNLINCLPFRTAIDNNDLHMIKILLSDYRINLNNLNISNIINIMNRPAIAEYILESNNINHNFINTCIQTYLIQDDLIMVKYFINHPKFRKNNLDDISNLFVNYINIYNFEMLDIMIDINNKYFISHLIKKIYKNYSFKVLLNFISNKVNDPDFIIACILDMNIDKNLLQEIYYNIISPTSFFDYNYNLGNYALCKTYLSLPNCDVKTIFSNFYKGKYVKMTKTLLNYY